MILQELYKLAQRKKLLDDTAFEERGVHFVVRIDREGNFVSLEPTLDERGKALRTLAPKVPVRSGSKDAPAFLVDNAQYTLGLAKEGLKRDVRAAAAAFDVLIDEALRATDDEGLQALQRFLARREEFRAAIIAAAPSVAGKKNAPAKPREWKADEVIAFAMAGEVDRIDEREPVAAWWRARVATNAASGTQTARCLVTGVIGPQFLGAHSKLKGVPEGQTIGPALISYNAEAFKTFGLDDTDPVSHAGVEGYVRALNWLMEREGDRRFRQGVLLDPGSVAVFWTSDAADADLVNAIFNLESWVHPDEVRRLLEGPWRGTHQSSVDPARFFMLTLSANSGRAVVRDWMVSSVRDTKTHLARWFEDLAIVGGEERPRSLRLLLEGLQTIPDAKQGKGELPPDLATRMFRCALTGTPLPRTVLARAVGRFRYVDSDRHRHRIIDRAALIRCAINRERRRDNQPEFTMALDPKNNEVGYVLGRLFAVLEQMQLRASGRGNKLNASIRDRYFGAASSTPVAAFAPLLRLSAHHASKLAKSGETFLEREKAEIFWLLEGRPLPASLDLNQQALFALGYYHQRKHDELSRKAAAEKNKKPQEGTAS